MVPTNHVCMDYEPFKVDYVAGNAYVGAGYQCTQLEPEYLGNYIAWDTDKGKIVWSNLSLLCGWCFATAGGITFGTLKDIPKLLTVNSELYKFKTLLVLSVTMSYIR